MIYPGATGHPPEQHLRSAISQLQLGPVDEGLMHILIRDRCADRIHMGRATLHSSGPSWRIGPKRVSAENWLVPRRGPMLGFRLLIPSART